MSHHRIKTTYQEVVDPWGTLEEKTVYADFNNSCNMVSFYDDSGNHIISVDDTLNNNLFEAMIKLYEGAVEDFEYWDKLPENKK